MVVSDVSDLAKHLMSHFTSEKGKMKSAEIKKDLAEQEGNSGSENERKSTCFKKRMKIRSVKKKIKFECDDCEERFTCKSKLMNHKREHKQLRCKHCGESFHSMAVLRPHLRKHRHDSNNKTCNLCGNTVHPSLYDFHKSQCREKKNIERDTFSNDMKPVVLLHKISGTQSLGIFPKIEQTEEVQDTDDRFKLQEKDSCCSIDEISEEAVDEASNEIVKLSSTAETCSEAKEMRDLAEDTSAVDGVNVVDNAFQGYNVNTNFKEISRKFQCQICFKSFSRDSYLARHMAFHEGRYHCKLCNRNFARGESLNSHICISEGKINQTKCDICGSNYQNTVQLYRHLRSHISSHHCSVCQRSFSSEDGLNNHVCEQKLTVPNDSQFVCKTCHRSFETRKQLIRHSNKHNGRFKCNKCNKLYSSKSTLETHSCVDTPKDKIFHCDICGKSFAREKYLMKHIPMHTGEFTCEICKKWFSSKECMFNHMRICSKVLEIELHGFVQCRNCESQFTDVPSYRQHMMTHTHIHVCGKCKARFPTQTRLEMHVCGESAPRCTTCNKIFSSVSNLNKHMAIHNDPKYECPHCGTQFHRRDNMMAHVCKSENGEVKLRKQVDKEVILEPLVCETCGAQFNSRSNLNQHRLLHGEKKYSCEECGKMFHRKDTLREHGLVHSAEYRYQCIECGKMLKTKHSLEVHMRLHSAEKPFSCDECGKRFSQKGNLIKHQLTHMEGVRFPCTYCGKSFGSKEYLKIHVLEHLPTKRYICDVCKKPFVKKHLLKQHIRNLHSNVTLTCEYCPTTVKLRHSLRRHLLRKHKELRSEWDRPGYIDMIKNKQQNGAAETLITLNQYHSLEESTIQVFPEDNADKTYIEDEQVTQIIVSDDISESDLVQHIQFSASQKDQTEYVEESMSLEQEVDGTMLGHHPIHQIVTTDSESKNTLQQLVQIPGFMEAVQSVQSQDPNTIITFEVLKE